jgi:hypothetical protein
LFRPCLFDTQAANMHLVRRGKKREISSQMDSQWGDPYISAPNEGSWNQGPHQMVNGDVAIVPKQSKAHRLTNFLRANSFSHREIKLPDFVTTGSKTQHESSSCGQLVAAQIRDRKSSTEQDDVSKIKSVLHTQTGFVEDSRYDESGQSAIQIQVKPNISGVRDYEHAGMLEDSQQKRFITQFPKSSESPSLSTTAQMRRSSGRNSAISQTSTVSVQTHSSRATSPALSSISSASFSFKALSVHPVRSDKNHQHDSGKGNRYSRRTPRMVGPQQLVPSDEELWG